MEEIGLSFIPENFYDSSEDLKLSHEDEKEQKEAQEQKDLIIKNVSNVINKIANLSSSTESSLVVQKASGIIVSNELLVFLLLKSIILDFFSNNFASTLSGDRSIIICGLLLLS